MASSSHAKLKLPIYLNMIAYAATRIDQYKLVIRSAQLAGPEFFFSM
jgi:hypothetical protein